MKNFLIIILTLLCLGLFGVLIFGWPKTLSKPGWDTPPDTASIENCVYATVYDALNPQFESVEDLLAYKKIQADKESDDSLFNTLSEQNINNIATVCLNKYGYINVELVAHEFRQHADVYNNLKTTSDITPETTNAPENHTSGGISYRAIEIDSQSDTVTINGKKYKIEKDE